MSNHNSIKPLEANTTYTFLNLRTGATTTGLDKEEAARHVLSQSWNSNYYIDFGEDETGTFSLGGEKHFINHEGDWDSSEFVRFKAETLDEVLDYILQKKINKEVFDEQDPVSQIILSNAIALRDGLKSIKELTANTQTALDAILADALTDINNAFLSEIEKQKKTEAAEADAWKKLEKFIGKTQLSLMNAIHRGEEKEYISDKLVEFADRIDAMPKTYEQEDKDDEAIAYLHYFKGGMNWYITEKDMEQEQLQAFGLADLNMGYPEIGYISISELIEHDVELDLHFIPKTIGKIKKLLRDLGRLAIAATIAVSMSACASPVWEKPNATAAEWEQTKADCMIEAAQRVPVNPVLIPIAGTSVSTESCDKKGRNCTEYNSFTPPSVEQVDTNAPLRDQAVRSCLSRKGWAEVKP